MRLSMLLLMLAVSSSSLAQDDPAALIADAIAAHGDGPALENWANLTYEGDVTFFFGATEITGTGTICVRDGEWLKRRALVQFRGSPAVFESASTGRSAWTRQGSRVYDLPPDNDNAWLAHRPDILLRAAADPSSLSLGGTIDLDGDVTIAVDFEEDAGTTRILLDEATHLVRALEYKIMRNDGLGKKEEAFIKKVYSDYRDVGGIAFPHRLAEYSDGAREYIVGVDSVTLGEAPEISVFARPEAEEETKEWWDQIAS